ncbi:MAG TPA: choice-of-anchor Q domain-containing protein [Polyangiaceae bacterium]
MKDNTQVGIDGSGAVVLKNTLISGNDAGVFSGSFRIENSTIVTSHGIAVATHFRWSMSYLINSTVQGVNTVVLAYGLELNHSTISATGGASGYYGMIMGDGVRMYRSALLSEGPSLCGNTVRIIESSYNRVSDGSCPVTGPGDEYATNFALAPLADNGGPVPTRLPGPGSSLVDAIPAAECTLPTDARGVVRPQSAGCDVGAVEVSP